MRTDGAGDPDLVESGGDPGGVRGRRGARALAQGLVLRLDPHGDAERYGRDARPPRQRARARHRQTRAHLQAARAFRRARESGALMSQAQSCVRVCMHFCFEVLKSFDTSHKSGWHSDGTVQRKFEETLTKVSWNEVSSVTAFVSS